MTYENQSELQAFFKEFEAYAKQVKELYEEIVGTKTIQGEKDGILDRMKKLEKRVKDPESLKQYITKLIDEEITNQLEIKKKEIVSITWKIASGFVFAIGGFIMFIVKLIIPFVFTLFK